MSCDPVSMTDEELGALGNLIREEQLARECPEFLPGHRACDRGRDPHDEHGYTMWRPDGRGKMRITWKDVEPVPPA